LAGAVAFTTTCVPALPIAPETAWTPNVSPVLLSTY